MARKEREHPGTERAGHGEKRKPAAEKTHTERRCDDVAANRSSVYHDERF